MLGRLRSAAARVGGFLGAYFAANAITAFMPLWFADRGLSAAEIGQVLGAAALLRVWLGPDGAMSRTGSGDGGRSCSVRRLLPLAWQRPLSRPVVSCRCC